MLPLEGVKVLDLSRLLPGPLCSQMLSDLGAEVVKVEDPVGGDYTRWDNPKVKQYSAYFHMINRNKKSICLNLKENAGREILIKMVEKSDILLETFRPRVMDRLGLGWEYLKKINPKLIYCSVTGYGQTGPYRDLPGHDINYLSVTGILGLIGEKGGAPVIPGIQIADVGGGSVNAVLSILAAYIARGRSGEGQYLDIAMTDGVTPFLSLYMAQFMFDKQPINRGEGLLSGQFACYRIYETADGRYMAMGCLEPKFWKEFLKAVNREELLAEQFVQDPRQSEIIEEISNIFKAKTSQEWIEHLKKYDVCCTLVYTLEEAMNDPHIKQRGLWFKALDPEEGEVPQEAFPAKFSGMNPGWRAPVPGFGEHTREILLSLGFKPQEIEELSRRKVIK